MTVQPEKTIDLTNSDQYIALYEIPRPKPETFLKCRTRCPFEKGSEDCKKVSAVYLICEKYGE